MDHRIFGKELTNLQGPRHNKSLSQIQPSKSRDLSNDPLRPANRSPHNRSLLQPRQSLPKIDPHNLQLVPEYFLQNLKFLRSQEHQTFKVGNYLPQTKSVTENDRGKLIDWLSKLHQKFKMFPETLFTIVSFIDQYLRNKTVAPSQLQLVGIAALFIAAKFQETYQVPPLKQLVSCCAFQYSAQQILDKESDIIKELDFNLIVNSPFKFFEPFSKALGLEPKNKNLAHYILELSLLQPKFLNYPPSLTAASVIYLIKKIRKSEATWDDPMSSMVGYSEKELKSCAKELCGLLEGAPEMDNSKAIKDKFSLASYNEVTRIKLERKDKK